MFYTNFTKLCFANNETPNRVANKCNYINSTFWKWRDGAEPSFKAKQRLADYFGIQADFFDKNDDEKRILKDLKEVDLSEILYDIIIALELETNDFTLDNEILSDKTKRTIADELRFIKGVKPPCSATKAKKAFHLPTNLIVKENNCLTPYIKFINLITTNNLYMYTAIENCNISEQRLKEWKNGAEATDTEIQTISNYFNIPLSYFCDDDNNINQEFRKDFKERDISKILAEISVGLELERKDIKLNKETINHDSQREIITYICDVRELAKRINNQ